MITELNTSSNIELTEIITETIIDEMSTNSRSVAGSGERHIVVVEISQQNLRGQSSAKTIGIPYNYSLFRYHKSAHKYFNDNFKINEFGHACSICYQFF